MEMTWSPTTADMTPGKNGFVRSKTQNCMEPLETHIRELEARKADLEEQQMSVWKEIEATKEKLFLERMKSITTHASFYARKLERIKKTVDAFVAETAYMHNGVEIASRNSNLKYGFRKKELPYTDDYHEVMQDPLDYAVVEYDLLGMSDCMEIRFDYHSEALKDFIEQWMSEHLPHMERDETLFGFRN
jgi:hypothetical protein